MADEESALVPQQPQLPTAQTASQALRTYLEIQRVFDKEMPDAILNIRGKKFRKKSYWRGIARAFNVSCEVVSVERIEDVDDWGYVVTVRATLLNGSLSDGDGACMASEKPGAGQATVHNVRSHAVTRAKNRAISDLVGFGEVSADELGPDAYHSSPQSDDVPRAPTQQHQPSGAIATEKQTKLLSAKASARATTLLKKAKDEGITLDEFTSQGEVKEEIARMAKGRVGCGETILKKEVDPLLSAIEMIDVSPVGTLIYEGAVNE
jgi:hypothetical protein